MIEVKDLVYSYAKLINYNDVVEKFRKQFYKLNAKYLIDTKDNTKLSDSEFGKIMLIII